MGCFFVDGVRFVKQAVDHGARIERLVTSRPLLKNPLGQKLARRLRRGGTPWLQIDPEVFRAVAAAREPQGIGAVVRQRWTSLRRVRPGEGLCWVAVEHVRSPGNLGTILRTCDAVGAAGLICLDGGVDPYDPTTVRASMGAIFSQRLVRCTAERLQRWARRHECLVVGASPGAARRYDRIRFDCPTVLVFGSERKGLSPAAEQLCDFSVRIPMLGSADSLNLGVAASLLLYEVLRKRRYTSAPGSR